MACPKQSLLVELVMMITMNKKCSRGITKSATARYNRGKSIRRPSYP